MDIVFDCPNCEQELAVDSAGAGSEIECPSCHETITIPAASTKTAAPSPLEPHAPSLAPSVMASSAAAKVEMHLKVPVSNKPGEILIKKAAPPLGAKTSGEKCIRIHTIKRASCMESGHDKFDEKVTEFLNEIGEASMVGVHTISYSFFDVGTQKILNDYGVVILYHG
jgi:Zn finger protein HypA/HybF involved in hydrogenase expression